MYCNGSGSIICYCDLGLSIRRTPHMEEMCAGICKKINVLIIAICNFGKQIIYNYVKMPP